jgi:hypothetical protein
MQCFEYADHIVQLAMNMSAGRPWSATLFPYQGNPNYTWNTSTGSVYVMAAGSSNNTVWDLYQATPGDVIQWQVASAGSPSGYFPHTMIVTDNNPSTYVLTVVDANWSHTGSLSNQDYPDQPNYYKPLVTRHQFYYGYGPAPFTSSGTQMSDFQYNMYTGYSGFPYTEYTIMNLR